MADGGGFLGVLSSETQKKLWTAASDTLGGMSKGNSVGAGGGGKVTKPPPASSTGGSAAEGLVKTGLVLLGSVAVASLLSRVSSNSSSSPTKKNSNSKSIKKKNNTKTSGENDEGDEDDDDDSDDDDEKAEKGEETGNKLNKKKNSMRSPSSPTAATAAANGPSSPNSPSARRNQNNNNSNNNNNNGGGGGSYYGSPNSQNVRIRKVKEGGTSPWQNLDKLGQGANGIVRRVVHCETGRIAACKEMFTQQGDRELKREMEVLQNVQHPNLVSVLAFEVIPANNNSNNNHHHNHFNRGGGGGGGCCRLVMEFCGNGTLCDIMSLTGPVPEDRLREYARQVLLGLRALHENPDHKGGKIVHRDLKPANLLVSEDGTLKIADFGGARFAESMRDITRVAGSPVYLSPEAIKGHFSEGSDLWALGASLVQAFSGKLPWTGIAPQQVFQNHAALMFYLSHVPTDPAAKAKHNPGIPDGLTPEAKEFFNQVFDLEYTQRGTCRQLLELPWFKNHPSPLSATPSATNSSNFYEASRKNNNNNSATSAAGGGGGGGNQQNQPSLKSRVKKNNNNSNATSAAAVPQQQQGGGNLNYEGEENDDDDDQEREYYSDESSIFESDDYNSSSYTPSVNSLQQQQEQASKSGGDGGGAVESTQTPSTSSNPSS